MKQTIINNLKPSIIMIKIKKIIFTLLIISLFLLIGCTEKETLKTDYTIEDSTNQKFLASNEYFNNIDNLFIKKIALFNEDKTLCEKINTDSTNNQNFYNTCIATLEKGKLIFKDIKKENPAIELIEKCPNECEKNNMEYISPTEDKIEESIGFFSIKNNEENIFFSFCYCFPN
jgi:uncharacterized protein YdcH (DUF465 family)